MFESLISEVPTILECLLVLVGVGLFSGLFAFIYTKLKSFGMFHKDMPICFVIFPIIICGIVLAVDALAVSLSTGSTIITVARVGVAIIGAVILIRFRSELRDFEDLTYLMFLTAFGFIAGVGYIWFALVLYAIIVLAIGLIYLLRFPRANSRRVTLKINVPEDINYEHLFDDVLTKYADKFVLIKVKTGDLGTIFVLEYEVLLKLNTNSKELLDEIRAKNGNLNVSILSKQFDTK